MSEETRAVVRGVYEALARADLDTLQNRFYAPEIEWHPPPGVPFQGTYRGAEEVRRAVEEWIGMFDNFTTEVEEIVEAKDKVIVCHRMRGKGKESGVEVDLGLVQVITVRRGRVITVVDYWTREEALKAAGLQE